MTEKRVLIGKIATAHGIKGWVKVSVMAEDPRLLEKAGPLYTAKIGGQSLRLTMKSQMGNVWLASIEGVNDRNTSETLRGTELWLDRDKLPTIKDDGSFYVEDLIGLRAVDESGVDLGAIIAVDNFGAGDLLEIRPPTGAAFYLPFTHDTVPEVDLESRTLTVIMPEGLLE